MNATTPVFQAQRGNEILQPNASVSTGTQATRANSQDFAGALNDADSRPTRKAVTSKQHDANSGGGQLPPSGNPAPSASSPPPASTSTAATTQANSTGNAAAAGQNGTAGQSGAAGQSGTAGATTVGGAASTAASGGPAGAAPPGAGAAPPGSLSNQALDGQPVAGALPPAMIVGTAAPTDGAAPNGTGNQPLAAAGPAIPPAAMAPTQSAAGAATPPARVGAAAGNSALTAMPVAGTAGKTAIAAAASAPTSTDGNTAALGTTPDGGAGSADTGAAAQTLMAAAITQGTSAPSDPSFMADGLAAPDTGAAPPGVGGPNGSPAVAMAASAAQATASSTAATAATAASIAQAISAAASAGAADKHAHGSGTDSSLSGTSNDGTAGVAQLMTSGASSGSTDVSSTTTLKVAAGVDTAEFGQGVADRVSLMVDSNLTSAKLQVNPPALGPIEVRIALQGGHAQVWFTSHSAVTRDALESSSPKLREMLGAQGFGQVSVDISQRSFQERSPPSRGYAGAGAIGGESSVSVQAPSAASRGASGLLDAYA
jgi:flagellar hook-length control protein FliK